MATPKLPIPKPEDLERFMRRGFDAQRAVDQIISRAGDCRPTLCPSCGAPEVESPGPRTVYECGSSSYDERAGTWIRTRACRERARGNG